MGSYKPAQVTVLLGNMHTWVSFKDEYDVELGFSGRTYRDPDQVHLDRLARAANNPENNYRISLDFSGNGPQITIHRDGIEDGKLDNLDTFSNEIMGEWVSPDD